MESIPPVAGIIYGLYCTCHPERGIRYVGRTIRPPRKRLVQHRGEARRVGKYPVHKWMLKHGVENISIKILEQVLLYEALAEAEGNWIQRQISDGQNLLNMVTVEAGQLIYRHSEKTRAKISAIHTGRPASPEARARMSAARRGRRLSHEHAIAISRSKTGSKNPASKISEQDVLDIREARLRGESCAKIARRYQISASSVSQITRREKWRHV